MGPHSEDPVAAQVGPEQQTSQVYHLPCQRKNVQQARSVHVFIPNYFHKVQ